MSVLVADPVAELCAGFEGCRVRKARVDMLLQGDHSRQEGREHTETQGKAIGVAETMTVLEDDEIFVKDRTLY